MLRLAARSMRTNRSSRRRSGFCESAVLLPACARAARADRRCRAPRKSDRSIRRAGGTGASNPATKGTAWGCGGGPLGGRSASSRARPDCARRDWIKLYPAGGYSFSATGQDQYQVTYPRSVLEGLIDETHRLGKKAGCHVYGARGRRTRSWRAALSRDSASIRNRST